MGVDVGGSNSAKSEPNVVPLCDILLVLLIIFMVVTPMIQKGANVNLPEASNIVDEPEPGQLLTVTIRRDGQVYLEAKLIEDIATLPMEIENKLEENPDSKTNEERKVLLKADLEINYGRVVDVMNEIKNSNIEIVGLVVEKLASTK